MTKLVIALNQLEVQERPNIDDYLPFTRQLIQKALNLKEVNDHIPIFKVDDNYLSRLDGTPVSKEIKELTLEHRLRSVLRVKLDELPVYKTLMERLQHIIQAKNEASAETLSLLEELHKEFIKAKEEDESSGESRGLRAIRQSLAGKISDKKVCHNSALEINEIVLQRTEGRPEWYNQDSIKKDIQRDLIIYLAKRSATNNIDPTELSAVVKELLTYIEKHYE
jgi:hypothetical protein